MKKNNFVKYQPYATPGERLNYILDHIGFKKGRGRVKSFQLYLQEQQPENFSQIKYSTVRSWFQNSSPQMSKIDAIISLLQTSYTFHHDISQIKTWWKISGFNPFVDTLGNTSPTLFHLQQKTKDNEEKLQFIVMSLVTEITGKYFNSLTSTELVEIKDKAVKMAKDFTNPFKTECPPEYIKLLIKNELLVSLKKKTICG